MLKAALTISFPSRASKVTLSTEPAENQNQQNHHDLQNWQQNHQSGCSILDELEVWREVLSPGGAASSILGQSQSQDRNRV